MQTRVTPYRGGLSASQIIMARPSDVDLPSGPAAVHWFTIEEMIARSLRDDIARSYHATGFEKISIASSFCLCKSNSFVSLLADPKNLPIASGVFSTVGSA